MDLDLYGFSESDVSLDVLADCYLPFTILTEQVSHVFIIDLEKTKLDVQAYLLSLILFFLF